MLAPTLAAALVAPALLLAAPDHHEEAASDVTVLFDGESTDAWEKYAGGEIGSKWSVDDGALHFAGKTAPGGGGDIQTKETFGDFDFRFEFKVAKGSNSGVIYGVVSKAGRAPFMTGPEFQLLDDANHGNGKNPKTSVGSLYALYAPQVYKTCPATGAVPCPHTPKTTKPIGEWNTGRVVKTGSRVRHYLNGVKVVDYDVSSPEFKEAVAGSKFKSWSEFAQPIANGEKTRIVLQDHGDAVWFRNLTIQKPTLTEDGPLLEG